MERPDARILYLGQRVIWWSADILFSATVRCALQIEDIPGGIGVPVGVRPRVYFRRVHRLVGAGWCRLAVGVLVVVEVEVEA